MSALPDHSCRRVCHVTHLSRRWLVLVGVVLGLLSSPRLAVAAESSPAARAAYASAAALQNREAWDLAAEEWRSLIAGYPDDPLVEKARYYLGICQLKAGDWQAAEQTLAQVAGSTADADTLAAARWELARGRFRAAQAAGKPAAFAAAANSLRQFLRQHPRHPEADSAAHLLGEAAWQAGQRKEAIAVWQRFRSQYPQSKRLPEVLYALGVGLVELDQPTEAVAVFAAFAKQFPGHPLAADVAIWRADGLLAAGRQDDAAAVLAPLAATEGPRQQAALSRLADLRWQAADWPAAAESFRLLATLQPDAEQAEQALLSAGRAEANAGRTAEASAIYRQLLTTQTTGSLEAAHLLAALELKAGQPQQAIAVIDQVLAAVPKQAAERLLAQLALDRADALWALAERRDEAVAGYEKLAAAYPDQPAAAAAVSMLALASLNAKQPAKALTQAERFLKQYATTATAEAVRDIEAIRAEALLETGKPVPAARQLSRLLDRHRDWPRREEALLLLARAEREAGNLPAAVSAVERCLKEFPDGPQADLAWYRLGQLRQQADDLPGAITAFTKSVQAKPNGSLAAWSLLASGWCQEAGGDLAAAEQTWGKLISRYPDSTAAASAVLARGDVRYRRGDYAGGLTDAEQMLKADSAAAGRLDAAARNEAQLLAGLCLLGLKRYAEAADRLRTLLADAATLPAADQAIFQLGLAESLGGEPAAAAKTFKRLVTEFPDSPSAADAWLQLGEQQFAAAAWEAAAKAYQRAIAAAPRAAAANDLLEQARHKLGWSYLMQNEPGPAAKAFAAQLRDAPAGPLAADARALQADALARENQTAAALKAFTAALADPAKLSSPELQATTFIRAAETAAAAKAWQQSLSFAQGLLAFAPESPQATAARYAAGWARQNLGQLEAAIADYRQVAEADRSELAARARFMEGEALFEQGNHKEAIKAFFKAAYGFGETDAPAAYHPWQAQATFEAARCFEVLKRPDQARTLYAELLDRYPDCPQAAAARRRLEALTLQQSPPEGSTR